MESIEHRSERLESQESVVIRRITESNQVNPSSTNFIQKVSFLCFWNFTNKLNQNCILSEVKINQNLFLIVLK